MILDGSEPSFLKTLYLLDIFAQISGLKVSYEKTEALWIGSYKNSNTIIPSNKPMTWAEKESLRPGSLVFDIKGKRY